MAQFISPQRKQEIIVSLELIIQESVEKISLYSDIYTYVDDMEPTHIPDSEVLPLKGDILREVYFKRDKMEKKIKNKDDCYAWLRTCLQLQTVMKKVMCTHSRTSANVGRGYPAIVQDLPKPGKMTAKLRQ